ncbi:hypothetical protein D3C87_1331100 [compost metagenome]
MQHHALPHGQRIGFGNDAQRIGVHQAANAARHGPFGDAGGRAQLAPGRAGVCLQRDQAGQVGVIQHWR